MTAVDLLHDLARLVPDARIGDRPLTHDEAMEIGGAVQRWVRAGRPGVPVDDKTWLCCCEPGEERTSRALPICQLCAARRPGEISEEEWAAHEAAARRLL